MYSVLVSTTSTNTTNTTTAATNKAFIKRPFPRVQRRYLQLKFKNYNQSLNLKTTNKNYKQKIK